MMLSAKPIRVVRLDTMEQTELSSAPDTVLCLGNFDGVHIVHRKLMEQAVQLKQEKYPNAAAGVFCFEEPSTDFLSERPAKHLSTLQQKLRIFREMGMEYAFLAHFPSIQHASPQKFLQKILQKTCHCRAVVCGFNYRFGQYGAGTPELLQQQFGEDAHVQPPLLQGGQAVSSTRIRCLLEQGEAEQATALLGRPYSMTAEVVHGKSLGRKMGIPTINQGLPEKMLVPLHGVYITTCLIDGKHYESITNVGNHPTVDNHAAVNMETFLLDFSGDLYAKQVEVFFLKHLRMELRFANTDALTAQINRDIALARAYFGKEHRP